MSKDNKNNVKVTKAINRYLYNSNDNFAFQMDGSWGTGKTYFIKHTILPEIKENNKKYEKYENNTKQDDTSSNRSKKYYIPIYESLAGIKNLDKLKLKLINSLILSTNNKENNKAGHMLLNAFGEGIIAFLNNNRHTKSYVDIIKSLGINFDVDTFLSKLNMVLSNNDENIVFIFDDLERTNINIKSLVGFLSNIIENSKCKIIIVSNIHRYKENYKLYKDYKEKIISRTVHFGDDTQYIADNLLQRYINAKSQKILNFTWINKASNIMMANLNDINLRTIISIINTYNDLFSEVDKYCSNEKSNNNSKKIEHKILEVGYLSIFVLTDLNKRNVNINFNNLDIYNEPFSYISSRLKDVLEYNKKKRISHSSNKYKQYNISGCQYLYYKFFNGLHNILNVNKYYIFSDNILFTHEVYSLVFSDIFNPLKFIDVVKNDFQKNEVRSNHLYQFIARNYKLMLYKKLVPYEREFIKSVTDIKDINFQNLLDIYSLLYILYIHHILINVDYLKELRNKIIYDASHIKQGNIKELSRMSLINLTDVNLKNKLMRIYKRKHHHEPKYINKSHLNRILDTGLVTMTSEKWFNKQSIFNTVLNSKSIQKRLTDSTNDKTPITIMRFIQYLSNTIQDSYGDHKIELKYCNSFEHLLKESISKIKEPVIKMDLNYLLNVSNECKKELSNDAIPIRNEIDFNHPDKNQFKE